MINIVANPLRGFFYFLNDTPLPPYFHWNLIIDRLKIINFVWNNIVFAKLNKRRLDNMQFRFINISGCS